jgi:hypothetical protein
MNKKFDASDKRASRKLLDQMMDDCKLDLEQRKKMHPSLAGVFGGNTSLYMGFSSEPQSAEENCQRVKANWKEKAKWKNLSYHLLFEHKLIDEYISLRVDEIRAERKRDEQERKLKP